MVQAGSDLTVTAAMGLIAIQETLFSISTAVNHECTRNRGFGIFEFSLIRNSFNLVFAVPIFLWFEKGLFEGLTKDKHKPLIVRIVAGNITFFTFTYVFKMLPLGIGQVIIQSNPFVVVLLSSYYLQEPICRVELACIGATFFGIVIMACSKPSSGNVLAEQTFGQYLFGLTMAVITMVFMAVLVVAGRALKGVHPTVVQLHYVFWGVVICLLLIWFEQTEHEFLIYHATSTKALLLLMGVSNTAALYMFIYVSQNAKSTMVSLFRNISVLLGFFIDVAFFDQKFTALQLFGALIVLAANLYSVIYKKQEEER